MVTTPSVQTFRFGGHVISILCLMILGIGIAAIVFVFMKTLDDVSIFIFFCFEGVVAGGMSWYATTFKLTPTGLDYTSAPRGFTITKPDGTTMSAPAGSTAQPIPESKT